MTPADALQNLQKALERFDLENSQDPNLEQVEGQLVPRELAYARWLSAWVLRLSPEASPALVLAARCQHLRRWTVPRASFPEGKAGYHRWRTHLRQFHAGAAGEILRSCGVEAGIASRVRSLNLKENFPADPEARTMEDALCLVFLERQFADLAARTERGTMVNALRKCWAKMTPKARDLALALPLGESEKSLLREALEGPSTG